ncbi:NUDIX hydrolase [Streptomyces griseorubiginosus]|uniref:NUDIX hydrolase n=1 Tax=Streptomyces griseorubiginosus TaxID=67304 RepID=UPI001AD64A90|nr:NUDIX domain-containing protein [Streptomyces griseorubiginosus]MBO4253181.1 NUDIX domain-containing protein [Streptomyces griseorubiginosus]
MPPPSTGPSVDVIEATELRLVEEPPPQLSAEHRAARDRVWDELIRTNSALFDGPVVACTSLTRPHPHELLLGWTRVTYRNFALRRVPGATALPSLFVDVLQPTDDGRLLIARMSTATAHPGRWHLPGGSVEHPDAGQPLDSASLRHNAARELLEELGLHTVPDDLTLWAVTCGDHGNVGVHFTARAQPAALLIDRFTAVSSTAAAVGELPELDRIAFVQGPADLAALEGPHADYLEPLVDRYVRILLSDSVTRP